MIQLASTTNEVLVRLPFSLRADLLAASLQGRRNCVGYLLTPARGIKLERLYATGFRAVRWRKARNRWRYYSSCCDALITGRLLRLDEALASVSAENEGKTPREINR